MSLILGVHLARKLYLVSDTRVTVGASTENPTYQDNLIKCVQLNERTGLVTAGNVGLAKFIIKEIKKKVQPGSSLRGVRQIFEQSAEELAKQYVRQTGQIASAVFIIAGFNTFRRKKLNSSRLGDVLSAPLAAQGDGTVMHQAVDKEILQALHEAATRRGGLEKNSIIQTNLPDAGVFGIKIKMSQTDVKVEMADADCFDYLVYYPERDALAQVEMSSEQVSNLEFRELNGQTGEQIMEEDALQLTAFVKNQIEANQFQTVGGNIFVTMVTPAGLVFPTGEVGRIRNGVVEIMGKIYVKEGVLCYRLPDGTEGQYRHLEGTEDLGSMDVL